MKRSGRIYKLSLELSSVFKSQNHIDSGLWSRDPIYSKLKKKDTVPFIFTLDFIGWGGFFFIFKHPLPLVERVCIDIDIVW